MPRKKQDPEGKPVADVAAECKHSCRGKETCGHTCCKRHLSPIVQLKAAQRLCREPLARAAECKHTCSDKLACGHQCCKRHLPRDVSASHGKQQPSVNLQVVKQAARKPQHLASNHDFNQVRRVSSGAQLGVQGISLNKAQQDSQAKSTDATPSFHFFIYDIESTGRVCEICHVLICTVDMHQQMLQWRHNQQSSRNLFTATLRVPSFRGLAPELADAWPH